VARARKRFGQHFLEPAWVGKLIGAIGPTATDHFVEIGPGRGAITQPLAQRVASVIAIEVDRDLAAALSALHLPNVTVVNDDVLRVDLLSLIDATAEIGNLTEGQRGRASARPIRVAGNLPYNISSPILFRLLDASASGRFGDAYLMLQKEVADRLVARPGTGDYGVLTLSTMLRADVTRVLSLPPGAFRPAPKVHSAVVRLDFRPPPSEVESADEVVSLVRSVFTQRRKTMANALAPFATARGWVPRELLARAGIDPQARPENLTLIDFARLSRACAIVSP
jgi:16S rRNA (adenine1518-N6/adenine1519-N6)-dimethyltransferase